MTVFGAEILPPGQRPAPPGVHALVGGQVVIKEDTFQHVAFDTEGGREDAYPRSAMGVISVVPQMFFDARHYSQDHAHFRQNPRGRKRPEFNSSLEALHKAGARVLFSEGLGGEGAASIRNLPYSAAQVLGVADRLGSIEVGKEATLFAADGDILDIRSKVKQMWFAGQETSLETRHTRLYEKYRNRPRP